MMKLSAVKAILSALLILAFCALVFSGALLYFAKTGVIWGIPRYTLRNLHICAAVVMCACVPVHLIINRKMFRAELRSLGKKRGGGFEDT